MADALVVRDTDGCTVRANAKSFNATGLIAGEALDAVAPCFVHSDGKVYMSKRDTHLTADTSMPLYAGFTSQACAVNHPVTLYTAKTLFHYAAGTLTEGEFLYIADTNGRITPDEPLVSVVGDIDFDAKTHTTVKVNAGLPVAIAWNDSDILIIR